MTILESAAGICHWNIVTQINSWQLPKRQPSTNLPRTSQLIGLFFFSCGGDISRPFLDIGRLFAECSYVLSSTIACGCPIANIVGLNALSARIAGALSRSNYENLTQLLVADWTCQPAGGLDYCRSQTDCNMRDPFTPSKEKFYHFVESDIRQSPSPRRQWSTYFCLETERQSHTNKSEGQLLEKEAKKQ